MVVLDQFEELLRYQQAVGQELLRLAGRTARDMDTAHIVIARSEYRDKLRPFEVQRADKWPMTLSEITDRATVRSIVETARDQAEVTFDDDAIDQLVTWWEDAREAIVRERARRIGAEGFADAGLLHFHALLWAFRDWALGQSLDDHITKRAVEDFVGHRASLRDDQVAAVKTVDRWLLQDVMVAYVSSQAGRLVDAAFLRYPEGRDRPSWRNGPRLLLSRAAPALTAAGFKQPQTLLSLLPYALGDELTTLRARTLATRLEQDQRKGTGLRRKILGEQRVTGAGIADSWAEADIVEEMITCLHTALRTMSLKEVNVLREYDRPGQPIYELVHDGMGAALNAWGASFLDEPVATLAVIAHQPGRAVVDTSIGAHLLDGLDADALDVWGAAEPITEDGTRMASFRALGWPASAILNTTISDVRFDECDFSGAYFGGCTLENVVFDGCKLNGALMKACALRNVSFRVGAEHDTHSLDLFTVKTPEADADITFLDVPGTTGLFLQGLAGGTVRFHNARIGHLVVEWTEPVELEFVDSHVSSSSVNDDDLHVGGDVPSAT